MKPAVTLLLAACLCLIWQARAADAATEKANLEIVQSVNKRLAAGNIKALEDLNALPSYGETSALIMFFKQYFYAFKPKPIQEQIAAKCAARIPEIQGSEDYFKEAWKLPPGGRTGPLVMKRETSIDCLGVINNKFAVRILCEALAEPDMKDQTAHILKTLLKMDIPSAPFPKTVYPAKLPDGSISPEGLAKWKAWWEEHKAEYAEDVK